MFSISTLEDVVRIPPSLFGAALKKAAVSILKEKYESMINANLGYIIMIMDAKVDEMGKIGITCRQPFLGADEWIQEEIKKISSDSETEKKGESKDKKKVEVKKEN